MSFFERDLVRRIIRQLGDTVARIAGLSAQKKHEEALGVVQECEAELLGPLTATLDAVDSRTVCLLLGSDDKVGAWAVLLTERAKLLDARGERTPARCVASRALELFQLLEARGALGSELLQTSYASLHALLAAAEPRSGQVEKNGSGA